MVDTEVFSRILIWLGLKSAPKPRRAAMQQRIRPSSATAHLFEKKPAGGKPKVGAGDDFNPYNTGKFDRSASWDRISKNQR